MNFMPRESPIAVCAAAAVLGLLAGLLLPSTRREDDLWGEHRDQLLANARRSGIDFLRGLDQGAGDDADPADAPIGGAAPACVVVAVEVPAAAAGA